MITSWPISLNRHQQETRVTKTTSDKSNQNKNTTSKDKSEKRNQKKTTIATNATSKEKSAEYGGRQKIYQRSQPLEKGEGCNQKCNKILRDDWSKHKTRQAYFVCATLLEGFVGCHLSSWKKLWPHKEQGGNYVDSQ